MLLAISRGAFAAVLLCASFTCAGAAETYVASLDGATAAPETNTSAIGVVNAKFDRVTHVLNWRLSYSGTSHTAAALVIRAGATAFVVPVNGVPGRPILGSTKLSDAEVKALDEGRMYFGLRTGSPSGGEIGGQMALMGTSGSPDSALNSFQARRSDGFPSPK